MIRYRKLSSPSALASSISPGRSGADQAQAYLVGGHALQTVLEELGVEPDLEIVALIVHG